MLKIAREIISTGKIFIQPDLRLPQRKIEIDGEDVSDTAYAHNVVRQVNVGVSSANVSLRNKEGVHLNKWSGGEIVKVYHDYASGTRQIFEGLMDDDVPLLNQSAGLLFNIFARDYGAAAMECPVTKYYTSATTCDVIFKALIAEYLPTHTVVNVEATTATLTPEWEDVFLWNCLQELAKKAGYLFYCGPQSIGSSNWKDWHFFNNGSRVCTTEMLAIGGNLFSLTNKGSIRPIKNYRRLHGQSSDGLPLFRTASDSASISSYWKKAALTSDESVRSNTSVQDKVDALLDDSLSKQRTGTFRSISLPTLEPGEDLLIAAPECQVVGLRTIKKITHSQNGVSLFTSSGAFDDTEENDLVRTISDISKEVSDLKSKRNPFGLENSYIWKFWKFEDDVKVDDNSMVIHYNTEVLNQKLVLTEGNEGNAVMVSFTAPANITNFSIKVSADYIIDDCEIDVSLDGGLLWSENLSADSLYSASDLGITGKVVTVRFTFKPDSAATVPRVSGIDFAWT